MCEFSWSHHRYTIPHRASWHETHFPSYITKEHLWFLFATWLRVYARGTLEQMHAHTHTRTHNHVWTHFGNEACGSSIMAPQVKPLHLMPISHIVLVKAGGSASHPAPCSCTEGGRKWPDPSVWASNRSEGLPGCFLPFVKWISGLIILSTSKVWEADYDDVKQ